VRGKVDELGPRVSRGELGRGAVGWVRTYSMGVCVCGHLQTTLVEGLAYLAMTPSCSVLAALTREAARPMHASVSCGRSCSTLAKSWTCERGGGGAGRSGRQGVRAPGMIRV
jgi:hypothetical protein